MAEQDPPKKGAYSVDNPFAQAAATEAPEYSPENPFAQQPPVLPGKPPASPVTASPSTSVVGSGVGTPSGAGLTDDGGDGVATPQSTAGLDALHLNPALRTTPKTVQMREDRKLFGALDIRGIEKVRHQADVVLGERGMVDQLAAKYDAESADLEFAQTDLDAKRYEAENATDPVVAQRAAAEYEQMAGAYNQRVQGLEKKRVAIEDLRLGAERSMDLLRIREHEIKSQQGTGPGATWNALLEGVGAVVAGAQSPIIDILVGLSPQDTFSGDPEEGKDTIAKRMKGLVIPQIREASVSSAGDSGTTKEFSQEMEKGFFGGAWINLARSAPAMVTPMMTGIAFQTMDQAEQEMQGPQWRGVPEGERNMVKLGLAIPTMLLEKFGFQSLAKNQLFGRDVMASAISKLPVGASKDQIERTITSEIKDRATDYLSRVAGHGALTEAATEGIQQVTQIGTEDLYSMMKEKRMFDNPDTFGEYASEVLKAAGQGAVGAFFMAQPFAIYAALKKNEVGKLTTPKQFELVEGVLLDPNYPKLMDGELERNVASGKITEVQAEEIKKGFATARSIREKIPDHLPTIVRREAFDILSQMEALKSKDPILVAGKMEALKERLRKLPGIESEPAKMGAEGEVKKPFTVEPTGGEVMRVLSLTTEGPVGPEGAPKEAGSTAYFQSNGFAPKLKPNGDGEFMLQVDDTNPGGKRSVGSVGLKTVEVNGKRFLSIIMTNVREGYEGKGLGTNMYRYLMENLPEGHVGILSPKETRWNKEQIPAIHEKLSKDYAKTTLDNGDVVFSNPSQPPTDAAVEQESRKQKRLAHTTLFANTEDNPDGVGYAIGDTYRADVEGSQLPLMVHSVDENGRITGAHIDIPGQEHIIIESGERIVNSTNKPVSASPKWTALSTEATTEVVAPTATAEKVPAPKPAEVVKPTAEEQLENERKLDLETVGKPALRERIASGKSPFIDTSSDLNGGIHYYAKGKGVTDSAYQVPLTPVGAEVRAVRKAQANLDLAETPEERAAAKEELQKALQPAVDRALKEDTKTKKDEPVKPVPNKGTPAPNTQTPTPTPVPESAITGPTTPSGEALAAGVAEPTTEPLTIFKGVKGKVGPNGERISAHEGVEGVFGSLDRSVSEKYKGEEPLKRFDIPAGTTVGTVEVDVKGKSVDEYRAEEVKAINASPAQVVKLITLDSGKGTKQEQYVIKDKGLIDSATDVVDAPPTTEPPVTTPTEKPKAPIDTDETTEPEESKLSTVQKRRLKMDSDLSDTERKGILSNPIHSAYSYRESIDAAKAQMAELYEKHGDKHPQEMADSVIEAVEKIANPVSRAYALGEVHRTLHDLTSASDISGPEKVALQAKQAEVVNKMADLALQAGRTGAVFAEIYNDFGMFASQVRGRVLEKSHESGLDNPDNSVDGKTLRENIDSAREEIDKHLDSAPELKSLIETLSKINQALREALVQKVLAGKATPLDDIKPLSVEDIIDGTSAIDRRIADLEAALTRSQEQLAKASDKRRDTAAQQRKSIADKIRALKIDTNGTMGAFIIPPQVINSGIEAVALAWEAGEAIADAISTGVKAIQKSDWYKGLSPEEQVAADVEFMERTAPVKRYAPKRPKPEPTVEELNKRIERQKAAIEKLKNVRKLGAERAKIREQNKDLKKKVENLDLVKMAVHRKNGKYTTPKKMLDKAMRAIRQGALWSSDLSSAFGEAFGITQFTEKDRDMVQHFGYALDYFEDSGQREMAQRYSKKFNEYLDAATRDRSTAQKVSEFFLDAVYQNALATISTFFNANVGSSLSGIFNGTAATMRTLLSKHGGLGAQLYGFRRWMQENPAAISKSLGRTSAYDSMGTYHETNREGRPSPYETHLLNGFFRQWDKLKNEPKAADKVKAAGMLIASALSQATRVGHAMRAIDPYITHSLANYKQAMDEYMAESKKLGLPTTPLMSWHKRINPKVFAKIDKAVGYGKEARADAELQADDDIRELEASGIKVPSFYKQRRISEILETGEGRDKERWRANLNLAREMLMMGRPDGLIGMASATVSRVGMVGRNDTDLQVLLKTMLAATVMFPRMTAASINHLQQGIPLLGTYLSAYGLYQDKDGKWHGGYKGRGLEANEKMRHRIAASLLATGITAALLSSMFDWDEDDDGKLIPVPDPDRLVDVTSNAYGNYKTNAGIEEGRKDFSVRVRFSKDEAFSDWIPTRLSSSMAAPLGTLGRLMDDAKGYYLQVPGVEPKRSTRYDLLVTAPLSVMGEGSFNSIGQGLKKWKQAKDTDQTQGILAEILLKPVATSLQPGIYREAINTAAMLAGEPQSERRRTDNWSNSSVNALSSIYGLDMLLQDDLRDDFGIPVERVDAVRQWLHGLNDADVRSKDHPEVALRYLYSGVEMPDRRHEPNFLTDKSVRASVFEKDKKKVYLTQEQKDDLDYLSRSVFRTMVVSNMDRLKKDAAVIEKGAGFGAEYLSKKMSAMRSAANAYADAKALQAIKSGNEAELKREAAELQVKANKMVR